jgi:hypothetical protein
LKYRPVDVGMPVAVLAGCPCLGAVVVAGGIVVASCVVAGAGSPAVVMRALLGAWEVETGFAVLLTAPLDATGDVDVAGSTMDGFNADGD